ncbi:MAG: 50S ribosomal protein L11 methyltransferase [Hyphomicrobiaceae bacterium]|nr:50S ribosomal protein L11 methyltransferase [Hyphomicrobiaceae bacterium]
MSSHIIEAERDADSVPRPVPAVIGICVTDKDAARRIAGALQDLVDPPPAALTLFEAAGPAGWRIDAYYDEPVDVPALKAALEAATGCVIDSIASAPVPDLNWVAISQAALPPVAAGRFTVHGSHDRARVPQGPNAILIDAGEAFGTAHHATTFGCLLVLDRLLRRLKPASVLDLGCGSGVLALAVARAAPCARVVASDLDVQSVEVARANFRVNRAGQRIRCHVAAGLAHTALRGTGRYDLLIANILAGPLVHLAPELSRALAPGGRLVLSGLLNDQAREVVAVYRMAGLSLVSHDRIAGWSTLVMSKRYPPADDAGPVRAVRHPTRPAHRTSAGPARRWPERAMPVKASRPATRCAPV